MELLAVDCKSISRFAVASPQFAPKLPVLAATAFEGGEELNRRTGGRNKGEGRGDEFGEIGRED